MIRLLLADDEDLLRGALVALLELEEDLTVVAQAATTTDAVRLARQHRPDIAVLDLEMPPADGLAAAEQIRAELPTRIVLVTRHARPGVLRRARGRCVTTCRRPWPSWESARAMRPPTAPGSRVGSDLARPRGPRSP